MLLKNWWEGNQSAASIDNLFSLGDVTAEELGKYDGRDPFLPILFSVRGTVFDVSKGSDFYGPGKH